MSSSFLNLKLADGYQLNAADGYSFQSIPIKMTSEKGYSITAVFSNGTPNGTLSVQVTDESDDPAARYMQPGLNRNGGVGWNTVPGSSIAVSAAGTITYQQYFQTARWLRLVYTAASGTCQLDAWISTKQ